MGKQNDSKHSDYFIGKTIQTGIVAGILFFFFSWLANTFHFSKFDPASPVLSLHRSAVIQDIIAIIGIVLISIILSLLYYALLRKRKPFITGIVFGFVLFLLLYSFISHSTLNMITVFCLLLCYCVFISMSISWIHERGR
ncbi:YqhR family membrane protein [Domibacillus epiphyticus]|uniref:Uncharacterized protein n=1 Tax=Domibacillus epiphyticus TaxID=1714355 RepID=A0A1V2A9S3_9BACI|nr:YqhR family membrane protein [Domibacillus epiphyticus]OMP67697.1 hypothetical protein BTO28_07080 [Domibacillus epiphyticus]